MRTTLRDVELFYLTYGRGDPLLIMHGGPGLDHSYFRPWLDGWGDHANLIYYDHRGHGRSGGRNTISDASLETWVDDADALRQHLKHERVVILGHGYGGFIAQHYARKYPQHTRGLILCDAAPALDYPHIMMANAQAQCNPAQMATLVTMLTRPVEDDAAMKRLWSAILPLYFYRYDPKIGAGINDVMSYSAAAYNHGLFTLESSLPTLAWLSELQAPTLVLAGKHDWLMPPEQGARRLVRAIPRSELAIFEESGHFPFIEEPIPFLNVVRSWMRKLAP